MSDYDVIDTVPGFSLEVGDQVVIEGDQCVIMHLDDEDPDEIYVTVDNLTGEDVEFTLLPFSDYEIWSI